MSQQKTFESYRIISFSGKMGSGKDTWCRILKENSKTPVKQFSFADNLKKELTELYTYFLERKDLNVDEINLNAFREHCFYKTAIDLSKTKDTNLKELLRLFFEKKVTNTPLDTKNKDTLVRTMLQFWGQIRKQENQFYWIEQTLKEVDAFLAKCPGNRVCLSDARFKDEIELLKEKGALMIKLEVNDETQRERLLKRDGSLPSEESFTHKSETDCDNFTSYDLIFHTDFFNEEGIKFDLKIFNLI